MSKNGLQAPKSFRDGSGHRAGIPVCLFYLMLQARWENCPGRQASGSGPGLEQEGRQGSFRSVDYKLDLSASELLRGGEPSLSVNA